MLKRGSSLGEALGLGHKGERSLERTDPRSVSLFDGERRLKRYDATDISLTFFPTALMCASSSDLSPRASWFAASIISAAAWEAERGETGSRGVRQIAEASSIAHDGIYNTCNIDLFDFLGE